MSKEQHDALTDAGINPDQVLHSTMKKVMRRFNERFHSSDSIGYAYGLHHDTANLHVHVAICPRTENGSHVGCSTSRSTQSKHKKQMDCIKSWFEIENSRWQEIFSSSQKLEETLSKRLDADKLVFSPKLNHLQMNALQTAQNSDSFRLQQLYQSIRNLEASLAKKRQALESQHNYRFVSRLLRHRQTGAAQLVAKIGTAVERRSLRELQSLLFKLKRQYRTLHKRYSQIFGFSSYAHRGRSISTGHASLLALPLITPNTSFRSSSQISARTSQRSGRRPSARGVRARKKLGDDIPCRRFESPVENITSDADLQT